MFLNKLRQEIEAPQHLSSPEYQAQLYQRLRIAIERIAEVYDPRLSFDNLAERQRSRLAEMDLNTVSKISQWEQGWIQLCMRLKGNQRGKR